MAARRLIAIARAVLLASCSTGANDRGAASASPPSVVSSVRIHVVGALSASVEPCDCQPGMAGGLDHAAAVLREAADASPPAPRALLLAAGSMLFETPTLAEHERGQALLKARVIAESFAEMKLAAWTPGASDFAAGVEVFAELSGLTSGLVLAANLELSGGNAVRRWLIVERGGLRVGVTGVVLAGEATSVLPGLRLADPLLAAKRAHAELEAQSADLEVLLIAGPRAEALRLVTKLSGFELAVIGSEDGAARGDVHGAPDGDATVGHTLVVAPASRLEAVELADLVRRSGQVRVERRATLPVTPALGTDPATAARLRRYDAEVNALNANIEVAPVAVAPGRAHYVGAQRCAECHDAAMVFWNNTGHARAYWTLVNANKARDLDCVGCHVTGHDQPGGSAGTRVQGLEAVQCEACHGPGSEHARNGDAAAIVRTPERDLCRTCHHSPHVELGWKVGAAWQRVIGPGHGQPRDR